MVQLFRRIRGWRSAEDTPEDRMSERPFMQLYVSDFIGDTLQLSTEQIGAYMLLLMAMWNAGGKLPADDAKLARVVRMSVKKWRSISDDLMAFFDGDTDSIWHNRLTKELDKSERKTDLRAASGAKGGAAKALKDKNASIANATREPQHLPDTRIQKETASQLGASAFLYDRLVEAASSRGQCHQNLAMGIQPIVELIAKGFDLEADILPVIRERASPDRRTWSYFVTIIVQRQAERQAIPAKVQAPAVDWPGRINSFTEFGIWPMAWGPKPGDPGCEAPAELIERTAA
jgi:uncharacterized protein YdaU (DUF1376 family)